MKKLFTLLIIASLAFTIQAQDITNQLGSFGKFYIKDDGGVTNFEFTHDIIAYPELKIGKNFSAVGQDAYMFRIQNSGIGPAASIENVGTGTPALYFHKSQSGDRVTGKIGEISFTGYDGISAWKEYAGIQGSLSASGGSLSFLTGNSTLVKQLFINHDGKVGIGTETPTSTLDVNGSVTYAYATGGDITLTDAHYVYICNVDGATVTLPDPTGIEGRVYIIKYLGTNGTKCTITCGNALVGGSTSQVINTKEYRTLVSGGIGVWYIIGK